MKNENLKLLVDNANSEIKMLANFLEKNKGLYEDRSILPVTIRDNKNALMREFNLNEEEFNRYVNEFIEYVNINEWILENDIVDTRNFTSKNIFNLRNDVIYVEDNKLDLRMTVLNLVYLNFSSDYFIEDFIGDNGLIVDYDNIENIVKEINDKYSLTSEYILEELRYRLDYIYYDLFSDFMNEMYNLIKINKFLTALDNIGLKLFKNYLNVNVTLKLFKKLF